MSVFHARRHARGGTHHGRRHIVSVSRLRVTHPAVTTQVNHPARWERERTTAAVTLCLLVGLG